MLETGATVSATKLIDFVRPHSPERPAHPKRIEVSAVGKVYKPGLSMRAIERVMAERLAS